MYSSDFSGIDDCVMAAKMAQMAVEQPYLFLITDDLENKHIDVGLMGYCF